MLSVTSNVTASLQYIFCVTFVAMVFPNSDSLLWETCSLAEGSSFFIVRENVQFR